MTVKTVNNDKIKTFESAEYNMRYDKQTGVFIRWGKTLDDNPEMCTLGPEILDIEISAGGGCIGKCPFCYKANGGDYPTQNMRLATFMGILSKFNTNILTQVAFGIMNISTNPAFFSMMEHAKYRGIVPNYTTHGLDMTPEYAKKSAELCGVVAVSVIDREKTFDAVAMLHDAGLGQVNIHYMLSEETYAGAFSLMHEIANDERAKGLHALVFLQYKAKGRGIGEYTSIQDVDKYRKLLERASRLNIPIGFDSCSAPMYLKSLEGIPGGETLAKFVEPCESGLFSAYINHRGEFFPCSFMEGRAGWKYGIDTIKAGRFTQAAWNNPRTDAWRRRLLTVKGGTCTSCAYNSSCRVCPEYPELKCLGAKAVDNVKESAVKTRIKEYSVIEVAQPPGRLK